MTLLPVVERELRAAARRDSTYRTRWMAVAVTLALGAWIWGWMTGGWLPHERGVILFRTVAGVAFAYALLAGITVTADSLSGERREGTLGFLFLTDLKGYDVVLGKLAATSLDAVYRLLAVLPLLAVPLLLGALSGGEFFRVVLVLLNTLFFSLAAGMLVSAVSTRDTHAMAGTALLILAVTGGPPLVGLIIALDNQSVPYPVRWLWTSAVYPGLLAFDALYLRQARTFWASAAVTHALGWVFLGTASLVVQRSWRAAPAVGRTARWLERWQAVRFGHGQERAAFRQGLLAINPVFWLAARDRSRQAWVFAWLGGFAMVWLGLSFKWPREVLDPGFHVITAIVLHTILKLWAGAEACRLLAEERRAGTLEALLSTPLTVPEILDGEARALKRQFFGPAVCVLVADLAMFSSGAFDLTLGDSNAWLLFWLSGMAVLVVDLYALSWVGLWLGLVSSRPSRAVVGTVARILVLPWVVFVFVLTVMGSKPGFQPDETWLFAMGLGVALINDAAFIAWSKLNLLERFRTAVPALTSLGSRRKVGP